MTGKKVDGFSYDDLIGAGWTHEQIKADPKWSATIPKKTRKIMWTTEVRFQMYQQLAVLFGPFKTWSGNTPVNKEEYERFIQRKYEEVGCKSTQAVEQQIAWAKTNQKKISSTQKSSYYENKLIAFKAGFLSYEEIYGHFKNLTIKP